MRLRRKIPRTKDIRLNRRDATIMVSMLGQGASYKAIASTVSKPVNAVKRRAFDLGVAKWMVAANG